MTREIVLFCVFFCFCYSKGSPQGLFRPSCDVNEEIDECPTLCEYDFCPVDAMVPKPCDRRKPCDMPACKCVFNYRWAENGTCIPTTECPPFKCIKPHEEFNPCPPYCPNDSCEQASENGDCPFPGYFMTAYCTPACRCIKGYWRKQGVCVPFSQC